MDRFIALQALPFRGPVLEPPRLSACWSQVDAQFPQESRRLPFHSSLCEQEVEISIAHSMGESVLGPFHCTAGAPFPRAGP
ncbi:hypothetical protein [Bacillus sp. mrc49]|uniref:hypothetical protein n=1 Tax=Bacillus sp. mrc49 TaxID=2054913 RepID=UPI0012FD3913|nr:hypothetical protein [Bacillus sp. mrc49]